MTYNFDDELGLERLAYTRFRTQYMVRRPNQAPTQFVDWLTLQLPVDSVLHTVNGFDTLAGDKDGIPDPTIPVVLNEKLPVWLSINTAVSDEHSMPFGVKERFIYRPNTIMARINPFYKHHHKFHKVLSYRTLSTMRNVLTWVDYSPLNEMRVNGTMHAYRKFDVIFRTILNMIASIGNSKHHFILLPQSGHAFNRALVQRTFSELSNGTLNIFNHDPSVYGALHVLGLAYGQTHDLSVVPYKEDVQIMGRDGVAKGLKSTSLFERLDRSLLDSVNVIFQHEDRAIVYNMGDVITFAQDASFYNKLFRHIMMLRLSGMVLPDHVQTDSDQFDTLVDSLSGTNVIEESSDVKTEITSQTPQTDTEETAPKAKSKPALSAEPKAPVLQQSDIPTPVSSEPVSFENKIRKHAEATPTPVNMPTDKAVSKKAQLIDHHFNVQLGGKTLGELIQNPPVQVVKPGRLDFVNSAPEPSYKRSSLLAMDRTYQKEVFHHELAKVVGSLAKHGYYATKIEEEKNHTEMDRTNTTKVHLIDVSGKVHHVKFTLPDVDANGVMKLGGTEYKLTRQIANIPICKVSPLRVNLSSYYNKIIVERVQSKRNSFETDIFKLVMMLRSEGKLEASVGSGGMPTQNVSYDYSAIGKSFTHITVKGYDFYFGENHAPYNLVGDVPQEIMTDLSRKYGAFAGTGPDQALLFFDLGNQIHQVDRKGEQTKSWTSFNALLVNLLGADAEPEKATTEWTQANIINQTIPLVYILAYKLGLKKVFQMINLDYRFYPTGKRPEIHLMDIAIRFADGYLVFNRYPLSRSLIAAGLTWCALNNIGFFEMEDPETYQRIYQKKGMGVGVLKGLDGFFDFFVDPITETVLEKMGEPTTFPELLLRANVMLSDYFSEPASSVKLHRFRLYERFNGTVYNEIFRALAQHRNNPSTRKGFSINPEAVFQKTIGDATISPKDVINPVDEVKQKTNFTFTGSGGRTTNSFVMRDRIYPKDGLGVVSDAVPDSGKVGITAYLSASPRIDDVHGIPKPHTEGEELSPPEILSIGSMVMPGGTGDDGKRNSYLSIQLSHYVPNQYAGETLSVRTGYDAVLPHLVSDTFSVAAEDDGVVEEVNPKTKVIKVRYRNKPMTVLRALKVPYLDQVINAYREEGTSFGYLVPESDVGDYPIGAVFSITRTTNARVVDRLRCESIDAIPDKDVARKQNSLIQEFMRGKYKALYYLRLTPMNTTTPGEVKHYSYATIHSPISGAYLRQTRLPNVTEGEKVKAGDILIYNNGFFVPDPFSKQVSFKHGVTATVALVEKGSNHEDACEISKGFGERLIMAPCHQREVVTTNNAAILKIVKVGDHVENPDSLCILSEDHLVQTSLDQDVENLDIMEKLSRQTPPADYTGVVSKIRILYGCDREKLSESLKSILKTYEKEYRDNFKALNSDPHARPPEKPGWVAPGTKYKGIDFDESTVVLEFMIEEELGMAEGDKLVLGTAAKSIVSHVAEEQHYTESGRPVDILFSTTSVINRIISSPFTIGIVEQNMEKLKQDVLDMYFE